MTAHHPKAVVQEDLDIRTVTYDSLVSRNRPSFYADPLAWAVSDFTTPLMAGRAASEGVATGLIVISDICSLRTIRALSATAGRGSISPLKFAGASPSIVAGLAALTHGLRGPTLALTMRPGGAQRAAAAQLRYWFRHSRISAAILVAHHPADGAGDILKGAVFDRPCARMDDAIRRICDTAMEPGP